MSDPSLPAGYREACYWKLTSGPWRTLAMNVAVLAVFPPAYLLFAWLAAAMGRLPASGNFGVGEIVGCLIGVAAIIVVHELIHGAAMRLVGARPVFGVRPAKLIAYATAAGHPFPRGQYLTVALAPLVVISLAAAALIALLPGSVLPVLVAICASANVSGSVGDLWIVAVVLRYPPDSLCVDEIDGVRVLRPA